MAFWRPAKAITVLLNQINAAFPGRAKASDGVRGDAAHQTRASDHNAWLTGPDGKKVVSAVDITTDPNDGADTESVVEALRASRDRRIKYIIWHGRMCSSYPTRNCAAWDWRDYGGPNPHNHHFHLSVIADHNYYDDETLWKIGKAAALGAASPAEPKAPAPAERPLLERDVDNKALVELLQTLLRAGGWKGKVDGDFGQNTEAAVKSFQKAKGLKIDGKVGPATWAALQAQKTDV